MIYILHQKNSKLFISLSCLLLFIINFIIVDMLEFNLWVQALAVGSCGTAVNVDKRVSQLPTLSYSK